MEQANHAVAGAVIERLQNLAAPATAAPATPLSETVSGAADHPA